MDRIKSIVITDIAQVLTVESPKGRHLNITNRNFFGLSFCKSGKITYRHRGQNFVSSPDCAVFLPMHASYELYNNEGGRFPIINFYCENDRLIEDFLVVPISSFDAYEKDFDALKAYFSGGSRLACMGLLYKILDRITKEGNREAKLLYPAVDYMVKHLCESDITNVRLAKAANISEVYLRTLFRACYHTSPRQYLISLRIDRAKQLLIESNDTVGNIATVCGFSGIYHFSRAFREKTGMTPNEYRRRVQLCSM